MYIYIFICAFHMYSYTCICIYSYICIYTQIFIYMDMCIYIYMNTYTNIYNYFLKSSEKLKSFWSLCCLITIKMSHYL